MRNEIFIKDHSVGFLNMMTGGMIFQFLHQEFSAVDVVESKVNRIITIARKENRCHQQVGGKK